MNEKDIINQLTEEMKLKQEKRNRYKKTTEYMDYVEEKLKNIRCFTSNSASPDLSYKEQEMIKDLDLFFSIVDEHARKNYIDGEKSRYETVYYIYYRDNIYEISLWPQQGATNYIKKVENANPNELIDFYDIMNDNLSLRATIINTELKKLSKKIEKELEPMIKKGINITDIKNCFNEVISRIEDKEKRKEERGPQKTLK